ncbi:MAG TPA: cyclophilin-like fold protein, partial [Methanobacteriaceae archaeon]|nr:cyclophilin-like fold protein [Methanobacteriaceae archaeon]
GKGIAKAVLDDRNPQTAKKIYDILPLEAEAINWQEEVYFTIPLVTEYENRSASSKEGDLSYWPPGYAFCIFYGASQPASEVNHIGKITENLELFRDVEEGDSILIRKIKS